MQDPADANLADYDRLVASRFWESRDIANARREFDQAEASPQTAGEKFRTYAMDSVAMPFVAVADAGSSIVNLGSSISNAAFNTDFKDVDWSFRELQSPAARFGSAALQFAVPYTGAVKGLGAASKVAKGAKFTKTARVLDPTVRTAIKAADAAAKTGNITKWTLAGARAEKLAKATATGFAVDFAAYETNEERLTDMIAQVPGLGGIAPYIGYDEDDSWFEARLKNSIEGAFLGVVGDYVLGMHRSRKAVKAAKAAGKSEGESVRAGIEALEESMEQAARQRESAYDEFLEENQKQGFLFPEGAGGKSLEADEKSLRKHLDEAHARGDEVDIDANARPTRVVDEEGVDVDLSDAESARLEAGADLPEPAKPTLAEGRAAEYDPMTGQAAIRVSGEDGVRTIDEIGNADADRLLQDLDLTPEASGEEILEAIKSIGARTDLPGNPRARGADGKLIDLPDDLSRNAANLDAKGRLLADATKAQTLLRTWEVAFDKQNWGARMSTEQLREATLILMERYGNMGFLKRRSFVKQLAQQSQEELQKSISSMMAFGHISNNFMERTTKLVDDLLQYEDTPDAQELKELADLFESLGQTHQAYTDHKSLFGTGLRAQLEDIIRVKDVARNQAMNACGMKP